MIPFQIKPIDRLFFRENRPFNRDDLGFDPVSSVFPPHPPTVIGVIRAFLAKELGWDGSSNWNDEIMDYLGDQEDLGKLEFDGPYLYDTDKETLLFPLPKILFGKVGQKDTNEILELTRLEPTQEEYLCSLSKSKDDKFVLLDPRSDIEDGKLIGEDYLLSSENCQIILENDKLDNIEVIPKHSSDNPLWVDEPKIGNYLDPDKKITRENSLFGRTFVRINKDINLVSIVRGFDEKVSENQLIRMGGEGKFVELNTSLDFDIELPSVNLSKVDEGIIQFCAILITPALLPNDPQELKEILQNYFDAEFITASIGKHKTIGGWNFVKNRPTTLKSYVPAGSTFFFTCDIEEQERIESLNGEKIGSKQDYGYGQILIGNW